VLIKLFWLIPCLVFDRNSKLTHWLQVSSLHEIQVHILYQNLLIYQQIRIRNVLLLFYSISEWKLLFLKWSYSRRRLILWLRVRFTRSHKYYYLIMLKKQFFTGRVNYQLWLCHRFTRSNSLLLLVLRKPMNSGAWLHCSWVFFNEQWSMPPLFTWTVETFSIVPVGPVRFKAKNALNWVQPNKTKQKKF
jgi:hypothetical protein